MKSRSFKSIFLTLNDPCANNWDDMRQCGDARFCESCSKNVIDFTQKGPGYIYKTILEGEGKVCGRFEPYQLNGYYYPELRESNFFRPRPLLLAFAMGCLVAGSQNSSANAIRRAPALVSRNFAKSALSAPGPETVAHKETDSVYIRGKVFDATDTTWLNYVRIDINGVYIHHPYMENGEYVLKIPKSMLGKKMVFTFSRFNYWTVKRNFKVTENLKQVNMHQKTGIFRKRVVMGCVGF